MVHHPLKRLTSCLETVESPPIQNIRQGLLYILQQSRNALDALHPSLYLGGDVDSVASITTGIMAGRWGLDSLPAYMLDEVEGRA